MVTRAALVGESVQAFLEVKTRHLKRYCGPTEVQDGTHDVDKFIVWIILFVVDESIETFVCWMLQNALKEIWSHRWGTVEWRWILRWRSVNIGALENLTSSSSRVDAYMMRYYGSHVPF
jgi:hypothetical protein